MSASSKGRDFSASLPPPPHWSDESRTVRTARGLFLQCLGGDTLNHCGHFIDTGMCPLIFSFIRSEFINDTNVIKMYEASGLGSGYLKSVCLSSEGWYLFCGGGDNSISHWDLHSQFRIRVLSGHTGDINDLAFKRRSHRKIPDSHSSDLLISDHHTMIPTLVSASYDRSVRVWNTEDGECITTLNRHDRSVERVMFDPSGDRLYSASDRTVILWSLQDDKSQPLIEYRVDSYDLAVCWMDDSLIVTAEEYSLQVWHPDKAELRHRKFTEHSERVRELSVNATGTLLASCSLNEMVVWSGVSSDEGYNRLCKVEHTVTLLKFHPWCPRILAVVFWAADTEIAAILTGADTDNDDSEAYSSDDDEEPSSCLMVIYDVYSDRIVDILDHRTEEIFDICWTADGTRVIAVGRGKWIGVYQLSKSGLKRLII